MSKIYYNDHDPYCCRVLRKQIAAGNLPAGIVDERDIEDVRPDDLAGFNQVHLFAGIGGFPLGLRRAGIPDDLDIWTAGFPCQDISVANTSGEGLDGDRSSLFFKASGLARVLRPRFFLLENVANLLVRGMGRVLGELAEIGFDAEWHCIPAAAVGAPHIRDRVFILAHAQRPEWGAGRAGGRYIHDPALCLPLEWEKDPSGPRGSGQEVAEPVGQASHVLPGVEAWAAEPGVPRMARRIPAGLDRRRGLGNPIAPQIAEWLGRRILSRGLE